MATHKQTIYTSPQFLWGIIVILLLVVIIGSTAWWKQIKQNEAAIRNGCTEDVKGWCIVNKP